MNPHGWLYLTDAEGNPVELINHARTIAYLNNPALGLGQSLQFVRQAGDGCAAYRANPRSTSWANLNLLTPSTGDTAPWYSASAPSSADGLGFWIEEWSGLDGRHHVRSAVDKGQRPGGGYYGPISHQARVWKLNVLLFARTEAGMRHLFRWLEGALLQACDQGGSNTVWVREICPTGVDVEEGLAQAREVVLLEGPTLEADPIPDARCVIKRASFTLGIGDPCLYGVPRQVTSEANTWSYGFTIETTLPDSRAAAWASLLAPCARPQSLFGGSPVTFTPALPWATPSPRVLITSDAVYDTGSTTANLRRTVPPLSIYVTTDRTATHVLPYQQGVVDDVACDADLVARVDLTEFPSGAELEVDFATRQVRYRDKVAGGPLAPWENGWAFVADRALFAYRWNIPQGCPGNSYVTVRPTYTARIVGAQPDYPTPDGGTATWTTAWTTTVSVIDRYGCV